MTIQPQRDIVLIKADSAKTKTKTGLLLAENWKSLPLQGEVLAVGEDVTNITVGDRVAFNRYASIILDDDQRLCSQKQVLGVINAA